jgi:hypothetical protein
LAGRWSFSELFGDSDIRKKATRSENRHSLIGRCDRLRPIAIRDYRQIESKASFQTVAYPGEQAFDTCLEQVNDVLLIRS